MTALGGFKSYDLVDVAFLLTGEGKKGGDDALIASGQTSGLTPTHRIPPGTVVVKRTGDGKFYFADTATNGDDRNTQATRTSTIDITDPKSTTFKWKYKGGTEQTFTAGGGDDDVDKLITAMNGDDNFQAQLVASKTGSKLVIKSKDAGADVYFRITDGTLNDLGGAQATFADNTDATAGADADYRVTTYWCDLKDVDAVATDAMAPTLLAGHFDESVLSNLTAEAKAVLIRRGSRFD